MKLDQEAQEASRPQRVSVVSATESKAERLADLMGGFRGTGAVGKMHQWWHANQNVGHRMSKNLMDPFKVCLFPWRKKHIPPMENVGNSLWGRKNPTSIPPCIYGLYSQLSGEYFGFPKPQFSHVKFTRRSHLFKGGACWACTGAAGCGLLSRSPAYLSGGWEGWGCLGQLRSCWDLMWMRCLYSWIMLNYVDLVESIV